MAQPSDSRMVAYTDGSCSPNPGPGGWAYVLEDAAGLRPGASGCELQTTNNRMELIAVVKVLEDHGSQPLSIYTDSQYVQLGLQSWLANWKRQGWRTAARKPVKNQDLWRVLDVLTARADVRFIWVRGHAANPGNELADSLAKKAIRPSET